MLAFPISAISTLSLTHIRRVPPFSQPEEMQAGAVSSLSPSFNSYSNTNLVEIAARVVEEFRAENGSDELYDEFYSERKEDYESIEREAEYDDKDEEFEFEFEFATKDSESSQISADEIFYDGKIKPVYPVFETHLLIGGDKIQNEVLQEKGTKTIRLSLRKLFIEERETATTSSSSSSEADELDGVPPETYCVWRPKAATPLKSSSTGSTSKRWKLKDFLHRSHSEGIKDGVVLLTTSNSGRKKESEKKTKETEAGAVKVKSAAAHPPATSLYTRDGGVKRRTYLPYRRDLVGFFSNANGFE